MFHLGLERCVEPEEDGRDWIPSEILLYSARQMTNRGLKIADNLGPMAKCCSPWIAREDSCLVVAPVWV